MNTQIPTENLWFYARGRERIGPLPVLELRRLLGTGEVKPGTMVLQQGTQRWVPIATVPELVHQETLQGVVPGRSRTAAWIAALVVSCAFAVCLACWLMGSRADVSGDGKGTSVEQPGTPVAPSNDLPGGPTYLPPRIDLADLRSDEQSSVATVEGVGRTPEEATREAFRSAVRQAVGALVDVETLVRNDRVINDQILTYSAGVVSGYQEINQREDGGLYRVTIRARVDRTQLTKRLDAAKVTVAVVDGESMWAKAVTEIERKAAARAMLAKALQGYPTCILGAKQVGPTEFVDGKFVRVRIEVSPDLTMFDKFVGNLQRVLAQISTETITFNTTTTNGKIMPPHKHLNLKNGQVLLVINATRTLSHDRFEWNGYYLDLDLFSDPVPHIQHQVRLQLVDSDDNLITSDSFPVNLTPLLAYTTYGWQTSSIGFPRPKLKGGFIIWPYWYNPPNSAYLGKTIERLIPLAPLELKRLAKVKCELQRK